MAALVVTAATLRDPGAVAALETSSAVGTTSAVRPGGLVANSDSPTATASADAPFSHDELDATDGIEKLEALAERYPNEPAVWRKLLAAYGTDAKTLTKALTPVRQLLRVEPESASEPALQAIVIRGASTPENASAAFDLMRDAMGSIGPDLLFDLGTSPTIGATTRDRAWTVLTSPATAGHTLAEAKGTPALRVGVLLKGTEGCGRKPLLPAAEKDGDARSIPYLQALLPTHKGCGMFGLSTCGDCFGDRSEVNHAIATITARQKQALVPH